MFVNLNIKINDSSVFSSSSSLLGYPKTYWPFSFVYSIILRPYYFLKRKYFQIWNSREWFSKMNFQSEFWKWAISFQEFWKHSIIIERAVMAAKTTLKKHRKRQRFLKKNINNNQTSWPESHVIKIQNNTCRFGDVGVNIWEAVIMMWIVI